MTSLNRWRLVARVALTGGAVAFVALVFLDRPLGRFFLHETGLVRDVAGIVSGATDPVVVLPVLGLLAAWEHLAIALGRFTGLEPRVPPRPQLWLWVAASAAVAGSVVLKAVIGRPRPHLEHLQWAGFDALSFGNWSGALPSAQAAMTGAIFAWIVVHRKSYSVAAALAAACVGVSRVMVSEHWISDVIIGTTLGLALGLSACFMGTRASGLTSR